MCVLDGINDLDTALHFVLDRLLQTAFNKRTYLMPVLSFGSNMTAIAEQTSKLLDFSQRLDINLLDNVVACMYCAEGQQVGGNVWLSRSII